MIMDKLSDMLAETKINGRTPHLIIMNRSHMKRLQKELGITHEHDILTYKGIRIEVTLPCRPVKNILIITEETWNWLMKLVETLATHPNCRCRVEP